jgi:hypothetical protein
VSNPGSPSVAQQLADRPTAQGWQDIVAKRPTQLRLMANNVRQRDSKSLGNGIVREGIHDRFRVRVLDASCRLHPAKGICRLDEEQVGLTCRGMSGNLCVEILPTIRRVG